MNETENPVTTIQSENTKASIENLSIALTAFSRSISSIYSFDQLAESAARLSDLSRSLNSIIEKSGIPQDSFDFLKKLDFQNEYIELDEDSCTSINAILESTASTSTPPKISKGKISLYNFVSLMISIFGVLLTIYYHKTDSIEAQKTYMEEQQYREEEIQLQKQELNYITDHTEYIEDMLNELIDHVKSQEHLQMIPGSDSELPKISALSGEVPESPDEVPNHSGATADECDSP